MVSTANDIALMPAIVTGVEGGVNVRALREVSPR